MTIYELVLNVAVVGLVFGAPLVIIFKIIDWIRSL